MSQSDPKRNSGDAPISGRISAHARTTYSGTNVVALLGGGRRLDLGGGLTARINPNLSLYANVDYEFELGHTDGGKRESVRGAVGLRYSW
jgi:outer membrane autotransporter protein